MSITTQDIINRLKENYPDEALDGEFLEPSIELAGKLVVCTTTTATHGENATTILVADSSCSNEEIERDCSVVWDKSHRHSLRVRTRLLWSLVLEPAAYRRYRGHQVPLRLPALLSECLKGRS